MPAWLSTEAKQVWRQLVPKLVDAGVLTVVDRNALARYCETFARWRSLSEGVRKHGETITLPRSGKKGKGTAPYCQQRPEVGILNQLANQLARLEQEFGLTPSSRTRIQVVSTDEEKEQDKGRFFKVHSG